MGRNTNQVITFNDAIYMRDNEGYTQKQSIPSTSQVMTKTEIEAYLYVDNSLFSTYATNRAVPYQKIAIGAVPDTTSPTYTNNLTLGTITSTSIQLNWVSTDNVGVTSHTVYVDNSVHATIAGNATTYTVTGLSPSTAYSIYVRATDAAGNFQNSTQHGNATTSAAADTIAPNVGVISITSTGTNSFGVSWTASSDNVGVTSHSIQYKIAAAPVSYSVWTTYPNGNAGSTTITGLNSGTDYFIKLRAFDAAGNQKDSKSVFGTTTVATSVTVSPTSYNAGSFGDTFFLTITTTAAWTLSDNASWITPDVTSGTGNASVRIVVGRNFVGQRFGQVAVNITGDSATCNVTQDASGT